MLGLSSLSALALALLPLAAVASPAPQGPGGGAAPGPPGVPAEAFMLYAYGDDFGGLPVIYYKGWAFLGNVSETNDPESAIVIFQQGSDTTSMLANPMVAPGAPTPSWSDLTYFVPTDASGTHLTGFTDSPADIDATTTGFVFYGSVATLEEANGSLQTQWYALPYGTTGLWSLNWNPNTDSSVDKVRVTLKSTPPSTPPPAPPVGPTPPGDPTPLPTMA